MFHWRLIVFINLFLIPILFHPLNICRHLIHIGHEPFHAQRLPTSTYDSIVDRAIVHVKRSIGTDSSMKNTNDLFRRFLTFYLGLQDDTHHLSNEYFYPNLMNYTIMYLHDHDSTPLIRSFLFMFISYFLLTYISSLVHVYRVSWQTNENSLDNIRYRLQFIMKSTYAHWMLRAIYWKFIAVLCSHIFHVLAVKIAMQALFISYGHFHLDSTRVYSWWNLKKNLILIYQYESWTNAFNGLIPRMIYELGKTNMFEQFSLVGRYTPVS
jgi:hypothetical protein